MSINICVIDRLISSNSSQMVISLFGEIHKPPFPKFPSPNLDNSLQSWHDSLFRKLFYFGAVHKLYLWFQNEISLTCIYFA